MAEITRPQRPESKLLDLVNESESRKILVVGDLILDKSVFGKVMGVSLETPTLKLEQDRIEYAMGGAGNVVQNLLELGAQCTFVTLIGDDPDSQTVKNFSHRNLTYCPVIESGRQLTVKERYWAIQSASSYKVLQVDKLDNKEISPASTDSAIAFISQTICNYDAVLLVDYRHGMMSERFIQDLIKLAKENKKFTIASSQVSESSANHQQYKGANLIVMNEKEANVNFSAGDGANKSLETRLPLGTCVTLDKKGSILYQGHRLYKEPAINVEEVDSCGAGDSFLSALSLANPQENPQYALRLANIWAGLSVQHLGAKPPKKQELINYLSH